MNHRILGYEIPSVITEGISSNGKIMFYESFEMSDCIKIYEKDIRETY